MHILEYDYIHILSDSFDYAKLICRDAGPEWAASLGICSFRISEILSLKLNPTIAFIVDNRLNRVDLALLQRLSDQLLIYKYVDEEYLSLRNPYMQYLLSLKCSPLIHFVTPYQGHQLTPILQSIHSPLRVHFLPYPYCQDQSVDLSKKRSKKLAIAGSLGKGTYPERWRIYLGTRRNLAAFGRVAILAHPGYPDIGIIGSGSKLKSDYIQWLACHSFFLVTPSVNDYEVLKYAECAQAGCLMVGILPSSLPSTLPHIASSHLTIRALIRKLRRVSPFETLHLASEFRKWFATNRDPVQLLNKMTISIRESKRLE